MRPGGITTRFFRWKLRPITGRKAILKVDRIGDYILARNFIEHYRKQATDCRELVFIGNALLRPLATALDAAYIDHFVWIDRKRFEENRLYRYQILWKLKRLRIETLYHPTKSREYYVSDFLALSAGAAQTIAMAGDGSNRTAAQAAETDPQYDQIITQAPGLLFEFLINKSFWEQVIQRKLPFTSPYLPPVALAPEPVISMFIGASDAFRKWPAANFATLGAHILQRGYGLKLLGGPGEQAAAAEITAGLTNYEGRVTDLTGKTSLPQLLEELGSSHGILSHDTAAAHIGAASKRPTIVLCRGDFHGRFLPYPTEVSNQVAIIMPNEIDPDNPDDVKKAGFTAEGNSPLVIQDIPVGRVQAVFDRVFDPKS